MKYLRKVLLFVFIVVNIMVLHSITASAATYLWPVPSVTYISNYYGNGHVGIDIAANGDHDIVAAREGTVIAAQSTTCTHIDNYPNACCNYGMGNYVQIKHSDGSYATYMHMRYGTVSVSVGQYVSRGTKIGMMGSSGNSTGQHLHFQVGYSSSDTINVNPDVIEYDYNTTPPVDLGTNFYAYIINTSSWKHLTYDNDNNVTLRSESWSANQNWYFTKRTDGSYKITSVKDGKCLDVDNFGITNGTNVGVCESNDSTAQSWYIYGSPGAFVLKAKCTDCVLDVYGGSSAEGTNIQMWEYNGSTAQLFQIYQLNYPTIGKPVLKCGISSASNPNVIFNWNSVTNGNVYDIRIYKNGESVLEAFSIRGNSYSRNLPDGTYTANIAAVNTLFLNYTFSENISFTVKNSINTVTLNNQGATTTGATAVTATYGSAMPSVIAPSKIGYTFGGYYDKIGGGGTQYYKADGTSARNWDKTFDTTLYAHWIEEKPYTNSIVNRCDYASVENNKCTIKTTLYNIASNCDIIVAGYKEGRLVVSKMRPYSQENESFVFTGDIDEIKVMVWDSLSTMRPLCDVEIIKSDKFITK